MDLVVSRDAEHRSWIDWGAGARRCAVGRSGIGNKTKEGDGVTPAGRFALRRVLYRPDRLTPPHTMLGCSEIAVADGWCDAPGDAAYNTQITRPYRASAETLWRDDELYDVIVVLGVNDDPVVPGKGSAIFLHVAREDYSPTEGCIALARSDVLEALAAITPGDMIDIRR